MFLGRCNGFNAGARRNLSKEAQAVLEKTLPEARAAFKDLLHNPAFKAQPMLCGWRFEDNDSAMDRVGTVAHSNEVLANPMDWALDALRDCARSDHWYTFEKEW